MKPIQHILVIPFTFVILFICDLKAQTLTRDFDYFQIEIDGEEVYLTPSSFVFWKDFTQDKRKVDNEFTLPYKTNPAFQFVYDTISGNQFYQESIIHIISDSTFITNISKNVDSNEYFDNAGWKLERNPKILSNNIYILKKNNILVVSKPAGYSYLRKYPVPQGYNDNYFDTYGAEYEETTTNIQKLFIYSLKTDKILFEKSGYYVLSQNENGILVSNNHFKNDKRKYSMLNWDGKLIFENLTIKELFEKPEFLKLQISNCQSIFEKTINAGDGIDYDDYIGSYFKYTTMDGKSGKFYLSGENEIYGNIIKLDDHLFIEKETLSVHTPRMQFIIPNFQVIIRDTLLREKIDAFGDLVYDNYGNLVYDTLYNIPDTLYEKERIVDTILTANKSIAINHGMDDIYNTKIIQENSIVNLNNENNISLNFPSDYNILFKKGVNYYFSSSLHYNFDHAKYIVMSDPFDPITWYDSLNYEGRIVYDTALLKYCQFSSPKFIVYNTQKGIVAEKNGFSIASYNSDGILIYEDLSKINYNFLSGLNDENNSAIKSLKKYWTSDSTDLKLRRSFWIKDIVTKPNEFLKSYLGSTNFVLHFIHTSKDFWSADTLFTLEYTYKNKKRILSNSQGIIEIGKNKKMLPLGEDIYFVDVNKLDKIKKASQLNKSYQLIGFNAAGGSVKDTIKIITISDKNFSLFIQPNRSEEIKKIIMPDPSDPSTWYDSLDADGNTVPDVIYVYPGHFTITNQNLDVIHMQKQKGISGFNEDFYLIHDIEISNNEDHLISLNKFSLMEINEKSGIPTINSYEALEGFINKNKLEMLLFPGTTYLDNYQHFYEINQLVEILPHKTVDQNFNPNDGKLQGKLKNAILPAKKLGKYGLIKMDGSIVAPFIYDKLEFIDYENNKYFIFKDKSNAHVYDIKGNSVSKINGVNYYLRERDTVNEFGKRTDLIAKMPNGIFLLDEFSASRKTKLPDDFLVYKLDSLFQDGQKNYTVSNGIHQETFFGMQSVTKTNKAWIFKSSYYDQPLFYYMSESGNRIGPFTDFRFSGEINQSNALVTKEFIFGKEWTNYDYGYYDDIWNLYNENGDEIIQGNFTDIQEIGDSLLSLKKGDYLTLFNPYTGKKTKNALYVGYDYLKHNIFDKETGNIKSVFCFRDESNNSFGIMDKHLNIIVPSIYWEAQSMENDLFWMRNREGGRLLDKYGKTVLPDNPNIIRVYDYEKGIHSSNLIIATTQNKSTFYGPNLIKWWQGEAVLSSYMDSKAGLITLKTKDSVSLIETTTGKIILRSNYKSINRFKDGFAVYSLNNTDAEGVIDINGVEIIPAVEGRSIMETYSQSSTEPIVNNGIFIYKKQNRFGLINSQNKEITGSIFEKINLLSNGFYEVYDGVNKVGIIDELGKIIFPIENSSISLPDSLGNRILSKAINVSENGKSDQIVISALVDDKFNVLLPFDKKLDVNNYSTKCDCYPVIIQDGSNSKAALYFPETKIFETNLTKFPDQNFVKEFANETKIDYSPEWKEIPGMTSNAVTAFYEDKNGNWWIGAGPRQGVYLSKDQGKNWIPVKEGLGNVHISLIGSYNDRIYAEVNLKTIHLFDSDNKWKSVSDSTESIIRDSLASHAAREQLKLNLEFSLNWENFELFIYSDKIQDYNLYESMINSYVFSDYMNIAYYDHFISNNYSEILWLDTSNYYGSNEFAKNLEPMLLLRSGNLFRTKNSKLLMIGSDGLFEIETSGIKKEKLSPVFSGAYVTSLVRKDDKTIFAVTSDEKIWKMKGEEWTMFYDAKIDLNQVSPLEESNISKLSHLEIVSDGFIFARNGIMYHLDKNGKSKTLILPDTPDKYGEKINKQIVSGIRKGKAIYGIAEIENYSNIKCLYKFERNSLTILFEFSKYATNVQLLADPNENLWFYDGENMIRLKNDSTGCDTLNILATHNLQFHKTLNGKFVLVDDINLNTYDPSTRKWHSEMLYNVFESGYLPIHAFAVDHSGNAFISSGTPNSIHYREEKEKYYKIGLSKIYFNGTQYDIKLFQNGPNPWITSITPWKDGLLVGTLGDGVYFVNYKR